MYYCVSKSLKQGGTGLMYANWLRSSIHMIQSRPAARNVVCDGCLKYAP
jgi:hypothetical protein